MRLIYKSVRVSSVVLLVCWCIHILTPICPFIWMAFDTAPFQINVQLWWQNTAIDNEVWFTGINCKQHEPGQFSRYNGCLVAELPGFDPTEDWEFSLLPHVSIGFVVHAVPEERQPKRGADHLPAYSTDI
jgi:hypothetical protein